VLARDDITGELPDTPAFLNGFECFHKNSCYQYFTKDRTTYVVSTFTWVGKDGSYPDFIIHQALAEFNQAP
jgi:hypothetical protein